MENQATETEKTLEERLLTLENIGKEAISRLKQRIERLEENYYVRKEMLTTDEVAAMLKVSKMTLYRWDKEGILRKIEVGGRRLYRRSEVEAITINRNHQSK